MKNLKQVLALGMAFSLSLSTMAGAAFTDQNEINAQEAVDMLSSLGIINGYSDGSFRPYENVTRAEAAKMMFQLRNGGNANADGFKNTPSTFKDISGNWAEGYIKYCQNMGIIAGKSATSFDPNGNITGVELSKMMLVTLGYNAQTVGLVGHTWTQNTLSLAGENGILNDVNAPLASACPRQYAAQIMYNTIMAPTVVLREGVYTNKNLIGYDNDTVGKRYLGLVNTEVTLIGDKKTVSSLNSDQLQVNVTTDNKGTEIKTAGNKTITYTVDKIEYKIGQNFKLLWKDSNNNNDLDKNDKIYGMYDANSTSFIELTANDIEKISDSTRVKLDGVKYDVAEEGKVVKNYIDVNSSSNEWKKANAGKNKIEDLQAKTGDKIRIVLDDSNRITEVYLITSELYKVTAVSGDKISIAGVGTIDRTINDNIVYDDIYKNDVVSVTRLYSTSVDDATFIVEKAEEINGTLTGFSGNKTVIVDGTTYKIYGEKAMKSNLTDDSITTISSSDLDCDVTLYLVNGYVQGMKRQSEEAKQYAIVNAVDDDGVLDSTFNEPRVELVLADGTKKVVTLHKDSKIYKGTDDNYSNRTDILKDNIAKGQLVKYVEMSNGKYKIEECGEYEQTSSKNTTKLYDNDTKSFTTTSGHSMVTSGDCTLFYNNGSELKAVNIRSLNDITADAGTDYAYVQKDGKIVSAYINLGRKPSGANAATMYGIVTTDPMTTNKNGDTYTMYTVAVNDDKTTDIYVSGDSSEINKIKKGSLVAFDKSSDDTYIQDSRTQDIRILNGEDNSLAVAVTEYNENDKTITYATAMEMQGERNYVATSKTTKAVDSDVKIAYVNSDDDTAGSYNYGINEYDYTTGYANALLIFDGGNQSNKVVGIIVNTDPDVNVMGGKTAALPVDNQIVSSSASETTVENMLKNGNVKVDGSWTANRAIDIPDGKRLTVNGTLTLSDMPTGSGTIQADNINATGLTSASVSDVSTLMNATKVELKISKLDMTDSVTRNNVTVNVGSSKKLTVTGDLTFGTTNKLVVDGDLVVNSVTDEENASKVLEGNGYIKIGSNDSIKVTEYISNLNKEKDTDIVDNAITALKGNFDTTYGNNDGSEAGKPWLEKTEITAEKGNETITLLTGANVDTATVTAEVASAGNTSGITGVTYSAGTLTGTGDTITDGTLVVKFTVTSGSVSKDVYAQFTVKAAEEELPTINENSTVDDVNKVLASGQDVTIKGAWTPNDLADVVLDIPSEITLKVDSVDLTNLANAITGEGNLTVTGKLTVSDLSKLPKNVTAGSIDAKNVSSMDNTNLQKLLGYSNVVEIGDVTGDVTVDSANAELKATSIGGKLTVTNAKSVTVTGSVDKIDTNVDVTVGSVTDWSDAVVASTKTLTVTDNVSSEITLPASLAGNVTFNGTISQTVTVNGQDTAVITFGGTGTVVDLDKIVPTQNSEVIVKFGSGAVTDSDSNGTVKYLISTSGAGDTEGTEIQISKIASVTGGFKASTGGAHWIAQSNEADS